MGVKVIKAQIDKLSAAEKKELLDYLIGIGVNDKDFELSEKWKDELNHRRRKMETDPSVSMPFHEFMQQYLNW
ncbi:MAG: addiction module protein [Saprospiraceae bacterium]